MKYLYVDLESFNISSSDVRYTEYMNIYCDIKIVAELDIIAADSRGSVVTCCSRMFSLWLERQPEASWRQLIDK